MSGLSSTRNGQAIVDIVSLSPDDARLRERSTRPGRAHVEIGIGRAIERGAHSS